jgi:nitrite reductase/ring-hydroxylating ferredoxin subunit
VTAFLHVGPVETLDADGETRTLLGRSVRIWRDDQGDWQAMEMVCRHQNADLSQADREGDIVTCPRHGWRYDLSTGACLTEGWAGLRHFRVKIERGDLYLSKRPVTN